jgi:uncharacterized membrane protein
LKLPNVNLYNFLIFFIILIWCIGFLWEIVLHFYPSSFYILPFLKYNFSIVCHTETEKLLTLFGYDTLVCSRCAGIYFGGLFSSFLVLLGLKKNITTKILLLSSVPLIIDVILYTVNIYKYSKYIALLTGFLLGSIGFIYIHRSIIELLIKSKDKN